MAVSLSDSRTAAWLGGADVSGDEWWNDGERCGVGPEGADDTPEDWNPQHIDGDDDFPEYIDPEDDPADHFPWAA